MQKTILLLILFIFNIISISNAQLNVEASRALISRVLPGNISDKFEVAFLAGKEGKDIFEIEERDGKIILRGNNGVSVASALHYYLRNFCHVLMTWNGSNLKDLSLPLPGVKQKIHQESPFRLRYYLNPVTFSYSTVWWTWERWQKEIDWMALNGINLPLALTGQNAILQKTFNSLGFSNTDLKDFFPGPAFSSWFWLNNLDGWAGPLPQDWIEDQEILQKKILKRERSLGMTPVLPAFTGHVPSDLKKKYPDAKINEVKWGSHFPPVSILNPGDSLFSMIGKRFLEIQTKEYGTDHYYLADIFNEVVPPSDDSLYLDKISKTVYHSMQSIDPESVWIMQGWLFFYDKKFWQAGEIQALLNGIPNDKMIILDLISELYPVWNKTEAFYGKPWIWNLLHNFGGNVYEAGCMPCVIENPVSLIGKKEAGNLTGLGLTMEGIEQNPALYQLMLDNIWRDQPIDLDKWIVAYTNQRYGVINADAVRAWKLLLHSVYKNPVGKYTRRSVIEDWPKFINPPKKDLLNYSFDSLYSAWEYLLKAGDELSANEGYQFDLVNTGRQVLADYSAILLKELSEDYRSKKAEDFANKQQDFLSLISDLDKLVSTNKYFLLGGWLKAAKSKGKNKKQKELYVFNARNQITLWGSKETGLPDYARKQWGGLLNGFYKPRWEIFFKQASQSLKEDKTFDREKFIQTIENWAWDWDKRYKISSGSKVKGDALKESKELFKKYGPVLRNVGH